MAALQQLSRVSKDDDIAIYCHYQQISTERLIHGMDALRTLCLDRPCSSTCADRMGILGSVAAPMVCTERIGNVNGAVPDGRNRNRP